MIKRMLEEIKRRHKYWTLRFIGSWIGFYIIWFVLDLIFRTSYRNDWIFLTCVVILITTWDVRTFIVKQDKK